MSRLRIVFLITGLNGGGAETMLLHLLRGMDRERFEPAVISLMPPALCPRTAVR